MKRTTEFPLSTREFAEMVGVSPQRVYTFRDQSIKSKSPRRPVLIENEDYKYIETSVMFSKSAVEKMKNWRKNMAERQTKIQKDREIVENTQIFVEIDGLRYGIKGKTAQKIKNIILKKSDTPVAKKKKSQYVAAQTEA